jgi:serine protease
MKLRSIVLVNLLAVVTLLTSAQQPTGQTIGKERLHDVPTPGVLLPLRTEPAELRIEPPDTNVPSPDVWELDPNTGAYYRRGELLVQFKNNATTTQRTLALQRSGTSRAGRSLPQNWELVSVDPTADLQRTIDQLTRNDAVAQVAKNYRVTTKQVRPNDEAFSLQWNFDAINVPYAWQINPGARNDVTVAVIDTGLNIVSDTIAFSSPLVGQVALRFAAVPDLVTDARITSPRDFVYGDNLPFDLVGHGTHVAGTIAEQTNNNIGATGIAYNVKLMPLKVLSGPWDDVLAPNNPGSTAAVLADAIRYAADNGAKIINMSLGGEGPLPTVRDAIQYAIGKGVFVSMAGGNEAEDGNPTGYPAAYAPDIVGAMAVGAVNRALHRADYSTFKSYIEICAPGGETVSSVDYQNGVTQVGYLATDDLSFISPSQAFALLRSGFRPRFDRFELRPFQGTSMAAPHVAGVAALLYSQGIKNPATIERAIKQFAIKIDARADECGAGLVDARRALRGLGLAR